MNRFYRVIVAIARALMMIIFPYSGKGRDNLPAQGSYLLVANHISLLDCVLMACLNKRQLVFIAKKELFGPKLANWFLRKLGAFPVDRGATDMSAMRQCINVLKRGDVLCIFPEGHRMTGGEVKKIEGGLAVIALRARVPIVPAYIFGPYRPFRRVRAVFGKPVTVEALTGPVAGGEIEEFNDNLVKLLNDMGEDGPQGSTGESSGE